eukprot:TRINITY_DN5356_c0_g1_i2.p1 TRINITY_DN5356_c0_g1~~TRINITY_DN5356_c0_g1_i2.p1  ORF type:complete len:352 (+),score=68.21 TRINITY_DN5356_c0_g1_i2:50-1057(+)
MATVSPTSTPKSGRARVRSVAWAYQFREAEGYLASVGAPELFDSLMRAAGTAPPRRPEDAAPVLLRELKLLYGRGAATRRVRRASSPDWDALRQADVPWLLDRMVLLLLHRRPRANKVYETLCTFLVDVPRGLTLLAASEAAAKGCVVAAAIATAAAAADTEAFVAAQVAASAAAAVLLVKAAVVAMDKEETAVLELELELASALQAAHQLEQQTPELPEHCSDTAVMVPPSADQAAHEAAMQSAAQLIDVEADAHYVEGQSPPRCRSHSWHPRLLPRDSAERSRTSTSRSSYYTSPLSSPRSLSSPRQQPTAGPPQRLSAIHSHRSHGSAPCSG